MPPKKKVVLPDHVRAAVLEDVKLSQDVSNSAEEAFKIRIFLATEQGVTTYELAEQLGVSQPTVSGWKRQGEQARDRRRGNGTGEHPPPGP